MRKKALLIITLLCAVAQGVWAWSGSGTASDSYVIVTVSDWATFAANVNAGTGADKCYKLSDSWNNAGNAVTATVGAEGYPFKGTFDGNGKTLFVNISETTTNGTAPFRDVRGATIENLTVEGSVTGRTHAAGLVGIVRAGGITTVSNCWVKTIVNCSTDGDNHIGGVVGHATTATLTIENTVFSGHLNSIDDYSGGLVGWGGNYTLTIKNSIFTGTHEGYSLFHPIALHGNNDTPTFIEKGAYYLSGIVPELPVNHSNITAAGSVAYTSQPDDGETYITLKEADGKDYYVESFSFIRRSWDSESKTVKSETVVKQSVFSTTLSGSHPDTWEGLYGGSDSKDHYYLVKGTVNYKTLNVFGRVNLILCDGAKLTCTGGIKVESDNSAQLNIYSQSDGSNQGQLIVTNSYEDAAGIGGSQGQECGEITIHGGIIDVTGGIRAAGIGAGAFGDEDNARDGVTTIYGGTITAHGGEYGAGIGGGAGRGRGGCDSGTFYLFGGTVTATGGYYAAGVGGGGSYQLYGANSSANGGKLGCVFVRGGTLNAQGGYRAAGIGGGNNSGYNYLEHCVNGGTVHIYNNAIVNATGGEYGAGIGGGKDSHGAYVLIEGGTVTATGGIDGAGIGGGENGDGGVVTVNGGHITAKGASYGSGIGGGEHTFNLNTAHGTGGDTYINGGTVIAIAGEDCNAREASGGSAIGGGHRIGGKGNVLLTGKLEIADNMMMTGGDAVNNIERVFTVGERVVGCRWRNYVKIEPCPHTKQNGDPDDVVKTYTIVDDFNHIAHCRYCAENITELHSGENCACGKITRRQFTVYQAGTEKDSYGEGTTTTVGAGKYFLLPECEYVPEGYIFAGWEMNPNPEDGNKWAAVRGDDFIQPQQPVKALVEQEDAVFFPRFLYDFNVEWLWDENEYTTYYTTVHLTHPEFDLPIVFNPTTITSEPLLDENNETIGTRYKGTATWKVNGFTYTFTDVKDVIPTLSLQDDSDNTRWLEGNDGRRANVHLTSRVLYKDGSWNTLCLPFDFTAEEVTAQLAPSELKTLSSSNYDSETGTLTLNFADATTIEAGKPYIIKWTGNTEWPYPEFTNVTIRNVDAAVTTDYVTFQGNFSPVSLKANDKSVLYLGADNKLYYPSVAMTVGSCRAIFILNGLTAGEKAEARQFVLNFGYDETTSIRPTSQPLPAMERSGYYTLDGRRLSGKPTQKGLYIYNGKKTVIK